MSLEQSLPPEPREESSELVSKLRIRTPRGEFFERRFLAANGLQVVFDYVASKGFPKDEYKLLSTFPRRDVSVSYYLFMSILYFNLMYIQFGKVKTNAAGVWAGLCRNIQVVNLLVILCQSFSDCSDVELIVQEQQLNSCNWKMTVMDKCTR